MPDLDLSQFEGHTPGPWLTNEQGQCDNALYRGTLAHLGNAESLLYGFASVIVEDDDRAWETSNPERMRANARLMAAAPTLLAEVRRLQAATLPPDLLRAALEALVYTPSVVYGNHLREDAEREVRRLRDLQERAHEALARLFPQEANAGE